VSCAHATQPRDLDAWAVEVTDPRPERELGSLAEWAAEVTDRREEPVE
jgi:hypothetical protein